MVWYLRDFDALYLDFNQREPATLARVIIRPYIWSTVLIRGYSHMPDG
jgi:hypothetical protein